MKLARIHLLLACTFAFVAAPASAQFMANDAGIFDVRVGGRSVGSEQFSIQQSGSGANAEIQANGRVDLVLPTGAVDLVTGLRTAGFLAQPVGYEVTVGGTAPRKIVGTIGDGRFSARIATPSGEQMREYLASPEAIVLDDGVAHHYYFLGRRIRDGRVPIIVPRDNRQSMATVSDAGVENVTVGDTLVSLYRLDVQPDSGEMRHVWLDDLGRVIRVDIPSRGYVAVRTELPQ